MKTINELKDISNLNLKTTGLSLIELGIVNFFKGDSELLMENIHELSGAEILYIIEKIFNVESVEGELNLDNLSFSLENSDIEEILANVKTSVFINKDEIEVLKSKDVDSLPVRLVLKNDVLGFDKQSVKPLSKRFNSKINSIVSKSAPKIVSLRNNLVMVSAMMIGASMFSSCGEKGISAGVSYKERPPIAITMPAIDGTIEGDFELNFANHSVLAQEEDEITSYQMSEAMLLTVPKVIQQINFQSSLNKPTLTLTANGAYVCSYIWVNAGESNTNALDSSQSTLGEYRMHRSCYQEMEATSGMVIKVENVPKAKTISMKFHFEK